MNKTDPLKIQSLANVDVILKRMTLIESMELAKQKSNYFGFLHKVVMQISNLDEMQINQMTIQDAIALTVYYRMYFWNDMVISDDAGLSPSNFIGNYEEANKESTFIKIGDYRFSPFITMKDAIEAEVYCSSMSDLPNLRFYIMGAGCTRKGIKDGIDTITGLMDGSEDIGTLLQYDSMIASLSNINLTFMSGDGKISILTQGGDERYALPFWGSRFFTFGI